MENSCRIIQISITQSRYVSYLFFSILYLSLLHIQASTAIFVRTFTDIIHRPAPYPKPNHPNEPKANPYPDLNPKTKFKPSNSLLKW